MIEILLIALAALDYGNKAEQEPPPKKPKPEVVQQDVDRTYAEYGAENGFTKEEWLTFYYEMNGFAYVNGIQVKDPAK